MSLTGKPKRITLFCGHYGSGKSTVSLAYAAYLRRAFPRDGAALADLDIVNPYFRSADCRQVTDALGVKLIVSDYAMTNVDLPAMPDEAYSITGDRSVRAVIDVGGDDRGALALGRFVPAILEENDFAMLAVVNKYRPLTRTPGDTVAVLREIEGACGMRFSGIVNCSNLGRDTTAETLLSSVPYAAAVSAEMDIPVCFSAALPAVAKDLPPDMPVLELDYFISHGGIINA